MNCVYYYVYFQYRYPVSVGTYTATNPPTNPPYWVHAVEQVCDFTEHLLLEYSCLRHTDIPIFKRQNAFSVMTEQREASIR